MMQINVSDMDKGIQDTDAKNVYRIYDDNKAKRDFIFEEKEKNYEKHQKNNYDPLEDIQYMPNKRYNEDLTNKFLMKDKML